MSFSRVIELAKDYALKNLPFLMDKGSKALQESKKKVTEYSLKQKINTNYKKIGQIIYKNKIKTNNQFIKKELDKISSLYVDIKYNENKIDI